jgi:hypothetical protein
MGATQADLAHIRTALAVHEEAVKGYLCMPDLDVHALTAITDALVVMLRGWLTNRVERTGRTPGVPR